jgi:hypothetical protein
MAARTEAEGRGNRPTTKRDAHNRFPIISIPLFGMAVTERGA